MSAKMEESAPAQAPAPAMTKTKKTLTNKAKPAGSPAKKKKKKSKTPGKYSQLVIDAIQNLGEKNGSSLFKIYNEAKKESWFDQQNGRMYLRYSIRALLLNDTLVQVKGLGANGSFKLNKKKFEKKANKSAAKPTKTGKSKPEPKPAVAKKASAKKSTTKTSKKKKTPAATKKPSVKKTSPKRKKAPAKTIKVAAKKATKAKKTKKTDGK